MNGEKLVYFSNEVANMFGLTAPEIRALAKVMRIPRRFGVWQFTKKDIEKIRQLGSDNEGTDIS